MNTEITQFISEITHLHLVDLIRRYSTPNFKGRGDHFSCPNKATHKRGDKNPSASIFTTHGGKLKWKCLACGSGDDILNYYQYVKGMEHAPFMEVLDAVCKELHVDNPVKVKDKGDKTNLYAIAKIAAEYVAEHANPTYLNKRNIRADIAAQLKIGSVPSFNEYKSHMLKHFSNDVLFNAGFLNALVMNERSIILTISNHYDQPVAFVARNMEYVKDSEDPKYKHKYCNTKGIPIYIKGQTLFMLNQTKEYIRVAKKAYVVEGYLDGVTMYQNGINIVTALGGVAFTDGHLRELKNLGVTEIIFSWDADPVGIITTIKNIEEVFKNVYDIRVRFLIVPGAKDADEFLSKHTKEEFEALETYDAIEYMMRILPKDDMDHYFSALFKQMAATIIGPHRMQSYVDQIHTLTAIKKEHIELCLRRFMMGSKIDTIIREQIKTINDAANTQDTVSILLAAKKIVSQLDVADKSLDSLISEYAKAIPVDPVIEIHGCKIYLGDINHLMMRGEATDPFAIAAGFREANASVQIIIHFHFNVEDGVQYTLRSMMKKHNINEEKMKFLELTNIMLIQSTTLSTPLGVCSQILSKDPNANCIILTHNSRETVNLESIPRNVAIVI